MYFWYDRDANRFSSNDAAAAFRRTETGGVGVLEMFITTDDPPALPDCDSSDDEWIPLTDPSFVDLTDFTIDNTFSYSDIINTGGDTQSVGKISMSLTGVLVRDANISKTVVDLIRVRNDIFAPVAGPIIAP
jgi:hypothetical protein